MVMVVLPHLGQSGLPDHGAQKTAFVGCRPFVNQLPGICFKMKQPFPQSNRERLSTVSELSGTSLPLFEVDVDSMILNDITSSFILPRGSAVSIELTPYPVVQSSR